jgi:arylsulfatase A-like enzyme
MYQMNHRVVANGTPLNREFDNVALLAKRAGYWPTLFGYTDQAIDPRDASGPDDWRLNSYEGVLPGFDCKLFIPENHELWIEHLRANGFDLPMDAQHALRTEPDRPEQFGLSTFLTDHLLGWLKKQDGPWFAHASYLRPHPPFAAAGKWSKAYDPADVELPIAPGSDLHPSHEMFMQLDSASAPADEAGKRHMRAQYYGMIGDVDEQLGRVWDALVEMNMWDNTMIIVTADHGEQLGDHGLKEKLGFFPQSYHILGIVRDPRNSAQFGTTVNEFTENIDIFPTIAEALGQPVPSQCDGLPLTPFLSGDQPPWWRDAATYEYDWRSWFIRQSQRQWPWDQRLEQQHLTTRVYDNRAYVQFGNGSWLSFDLAADPTWRTYLTDTSATLQMTQDMLVWRSRHTNRQLTSMLIENGGIGQWPDGVAWRD